MGIGLLSGAGAGLSFRGVPESNGTSVTISVLEIAAGLGIELTDRLSAGATLILGNSTLDAPFQGIGAAAYAYQLRGSVGLTYDFAESTTLGFYYQTRQNFNYDDAIRIDLGGGAFSAVQDVNLGLPDNFGLGFANNSLMDGRMLLATDVLFKSWDTADTFNVLYENQWVFQVGAQYELTLRIRLRTGYVYAENPLNSTLAGRPGGVIPGGPIVPRAAVPPFHRGGYEPASYHRGSGGPRPVTRR